MPSVRVDATVSVGVATFPVITPDMTADRALHIAYAALAEAKHNGGNCVEIKEAPPVAK